jgi:serine/threonine protein kinase
MNDRDERFVDPDLFNSK